MERRTIVLTTYGKSRDLDHEDCVIPLERDLGLLVLQTRKHSHIDVARSLLATTALGHGADVAVFIDHDMIFDPLDVERLADVARETRGVVGAPYSERRMGGACQGAFSPETTEITFFEGGGLYPAAGVVGMGFTAIHRAAFESLHLLPQYAERLFALEMMRPYFEKITVDGVWMSEDASFCHAVRQQGVRTEIDTRIRVKHVGDYWYGVEDCRRKLKDEPTLTVRHVSVPR